MTTLLISRTYSEVTPESAEDGDFSDTGLVYENTEFTFRELVRELRDCSQLSASHPGDCWHVWASTGFFTSDYSTGTEREESVHFSRDNDHRLVKYWRKALKAAGLIK